MCKTKWKNCLATATVEVLSLVLFVCANTTSSSMIYQPKAPEKLKDFSMIK